jgi:putative transposase
VHIKTEEEFRETLKVSNTFKVSAQFSNFFNAYAKSINQAYHRCGSLFQHPFGRERISQSYHFERAIVYIHQNPQKHGLIKDFRDWKYSSYQTLIMDGPTHLNRQEVLVWFGGRDGFVEAHKQWEIASVPDSNPKGLQDL